MMHYITMPLQGEKNMRIHRLPQQNPPKPPGSPHSQEPNMPSVQPSRGRPVWTSGCQLVSPAWCLELTHCATRAHRVPGAQFHCECGSAAVAQRGRCRGPRSHHLLSSSFDYAMLTHTVTQLHLDHAPHDASLNRAVVALPPCSKLQRGTHHSGLSQQSARVTYTGVSGTAGLL